MASERAECPERHLEHLTPPCRADRLRKDDESLLLAMRRNRSVHSSDAFSGEIRFFLRFQLTTHASDMLEFSTTRYLDTIFNFWRSLTTNPEETKKVKVQVIREKDLH